MVVRQNWMTSRMRHRTVAFERSKSEEAQATQGGGRDIEPRLTFEEAARL